MSFIFSNTNCYPVDNTDCEIKVCSVSSLLYDSVTEAFDLDYPGKFPDVFPRLVGSLNGLICLAIGLFYGLYDLFLWNPSIRKYKKLPSYTLNLDEPVDSNFGFAYDECQDDNKVVVIFPVYERGQGHLIRIEVKMIYNLKSDSWRHIDDLQDRELLGDSGKFVKGKLHWLDKQWNIISIDLADKKWAEVEQPCYFKGCGFMKVGVFESDLSVFCNYAWTYVDIWVMKEYGVRESWTKMFTIKPLEDSTPNIFYPTVLMSNEGEILLQHGSHFTKYNPKDDSIRFLGVTNLAPCGEVEIYVKSLVCTF